MFSQKIADTICESIAEGKSLRKAAAQVGISHSTVLAWVDSEPAFADQYARARMIGYKLLADEIIDISDEVSADYDGGKPNPEQVARSRLRVDSRKWLLSKMLPKIYGDKLDLNHSGYIATPKELTEDELSRIVNTTGSVSVPEKPGFDGS